MLCNCSKLRLYLDLRTANKNDTARQNTPRLAYIPHIFEPGLGQAWARPGPSKRRSARWSPALRRARTAHLLCRRQTEAVSDLFAGRSAEISADVGLSIGDGFEVRTYREQEESRCGIGSVIEVLCGLAIIVLQKTTEPLVASDFADLSPTSITFPQPRQLHLPIPKGVKSVVDDVFLTLAVVGSARKGGMGGKLRRGRRSWFPPVGAKPPEILSVRSTLRFLVPSVFTFRLLPSFWSRGWISGYSVWPRLLGSFRMSARG